MLETTKKALIEDEKPLIWTGDETPEGICHKKKMFFCTKMGRMEQSTTLLLKKLSQRLITIPRADYNINF